MEMLDLTYKAITYHPIYMLNFLKIFSHDKCDKPIEEILSPFDPEFRSALLSMYRGDPQTGSDGEKYPLDGVTKIDAQSVLFIYEFCLSVKPENIIEIGMAYGFSTISFLAAITHNRYGHHSSIDPFQHSDWKGIGLNHAMSLASKMAQRSTFKLYEDRSDRTVTDLARSNRTFDLIFIDGNHRFDDVLTDFYLYAPLCEVGGHIIFDDTWMRSIQTVVSFVRNNRLDFKEITQNLSRFSVFKKIAEDSRRWNHFIPFPVAQKPY